MLALAYFIPSVGHLLAGKGLEASPNTTQLLQDGLSKKATHAAILASGSLAELAVTTILILIGTLVLMLPVSWVYMSARRVQGHNQAVVQTLIILPLVVAGVIIVVQNSLALAFSLAGVVGAVRFRTTLRDTRDLVFIFLSIGVGFAAGVEVARRRCAPVDRLQLRPDPDVALRLRPKRSHAERERAVGGSARSTRQSHGRASRSRSRSRALAHSAARRRARRPVRARARRHRKEKEESAVQRRSHDYHRSGGAKRRQRSRPFSKR